MLSLRILENHILILKNLGKQYTFSLLYTLIPWKTMPFSQKFLERFTKISVDTLYQNYIDFPPFAVNSYQYIVCKSDLLLGLDHETTHTNM